MNVPTDSDKCSSSIECSEDEACLHINDVKACHKCTKEIYHKYQECSIRKVACTSSPCQNNGVCINTLAGSYECHCTAGYYGKLCEYKEDFTSCNEELCVHGRCEHVGVSKVRCICVAGWKGARCQVSLHFLLSLALLRHKFIHIFIHSIIDSLVNLYIFKTRIKCFSR